MQNLMHKHVCVCKPNFCGQKSTDTQCNTRTFCFLSVTIFPKRHRCILTTKRKRDRKRKKNVTTLYKRPFLNIQFFAVTLFGHQQQYSILNLEVTGSQSYLVGQFVKLWQCIQFGNKNIVLPSRENKYLLFQIP